jgi:hypothetical protein
MTGTLVGQGAAERTGLPPNSESWYRHGLATSAYIRPDRCSGRFELRFDLRSLQKMLEAQQCRALRCKMTDI